MMTGWNSERFPKRFCISNRPAKIDTCVLIPVRLRYIVPTNELPGGNVLDFVNKFLQFEGIWIVFQKVELRSESMGSNAQEENQWFQRQGPGQPKSECGMIRDVSPLSPEPVNFFKVVFVGLFEKESVVNDYRLIS